MYIFYNIICYIYDITYITYITVHNITYIYCANDHTDFCFKQKY